MRAAMVEPEVIELWPCGYTARCARRRSAAGATVILRYRQLGISDHQTGVYDTHARELSAELNVIDRRR
jgi:hypothetical protein